MSDKSLHHFVSLRSALSRVTNSQEHLLDKLASIVAADADVEPPVASSLCDIERLQSVGLETAEQELVLKAVQCALQEKADHICGPECSITGSELLDVLISIPPVPQVRMAFNIGDTRKRTELLYRLFYQKDIECASALYKVQKQLAAEQRQQQEQEQQRLLRGVMHSTEITGSSHIKVE